MSRQVEQYDSGEVIYVAVDPAGAWARSEFPDELVTVDYDAEGKVIGVEVVGSAARTLAAALAHALDDYEPLENRKAVKETLAALA